MAGGVCPPSPRKEDCRTADCNEHRKLPAHTRRNPPMDVPEKEDRTGGDPNDDLRACECRGTFAGADTVGREPVYGVAWRAYSGGDSGRADGTVQVHAGLQRGGGGDMRRTLVARRVGTGGERSAGRIRGGTGGDERKDQSGGEAGDAGMRRGGYAGGVCGEDEIMGDALGNVGGFLFLCRKIYKYERLWQR